MPDPSKTSSRPEMTFAERHLPDWAQHLSLGGWVILVLAVLSSIGIALTPVEKPEGMEVWTFANNHMRAYIPIVEQWNQTREPRVNMILLEGGALERRMLSGFLSGTPIADAMEAHQVIASKAFTGPIEDVGFLDLTERLHEQGIYERINEPSFSPWTSRGHIFGLPHDVHPVLLAYRSDIVEAAGIDMSTIETWDEYVETLRPLVQDLDGDGRPDRYLLNLWETATSHIEMLILQAGGRYFDENEDPAIDSEINAYVISKIVTWIAGPGRIAADTPEFSASGNQLRLEGYVIGSLMPDWLSDVWENDMPRLAGKVKLMPLPAWEPGGRRTSVWGGTMIGVVKDSPYREQAWEFAQTLYLSPDLAKDLFLTTNIISPVKSMWDEPFYDTPFPYYSNQPIGRMYIDQAEDVPLRSSSPYSSLAATRVQQAVAKLKQYAEANGVFDVESLQPEARRLLGNAQAYVRRQIDSNVFLREDE